MIVLKSMKWQIHVGVYILGHNNFGKFEAHVLTTMNIFLRNLAQAIFKSYPNSDKFFDKLYNIFRKLDHLTCTKIPKLI